MRGSTRVRTSRGSARWGAQKGLSLKADDCHYTRLHLRRTYPDTLYNPTEAMTRTSDRAGEIRKPPARYGEACQVQDCHPRCVSGGQEEVGVAICSICRLLLFAFLFRFLTALLKRRGAAAQHQKAALLCVDQSG